MHMQKPTNVPGSALSATPRPPSPSVPMSQVWGLHVSLSALPASGLPDNPSTATGGFPSLRSQGPNSENGDNRLTPSRLPLQSYALGCTAQSAGRVFANAISLHSPILAPKPWTGFHRSQGPRSWHDQFLWPVHSDILARSPWPGGWAVAP